MRRLPRADPYLGFFLASICSYVSMQSMLRHERLSTRSLGVVVLAAVLVTALHALFQRVPLVPLPAGVWEY